ncbi:MAG: undecaprenyl/decaprenyl-phosphate alpha-N-acetylglucosaminyl 1-phosphate transferase [Spirochaetes bacterium]|nr:undecaprenyl/decaprenyl-phosphate alpha-N-acetylglucosaminyl 1-phosphate transferase [Spirochaetota bacterium]
MKIEFNFFIIIPFIVSFLLIPLINYISHKKKLFDYIDERKIHKRNISRLGGLAIFTGFLVFYLYLLFIKNIKFNFNPYLFLLAFTVAFLTGFIDDLVHIKARLKLFLQIISGLIVCFSGLSFDGINIPGFIKIDFGYFTYIFTPLWIAAFMNAINMLDGMDGLAGGILFISFIFVTIIGFIQNNLLVFYISLSLSLSTFAFLIFNFPPAKIFMGDGGAYFLGFIYSILPLIGIKKLSTLTIFVIPLMLLSVPIIDIVSVSHKRIKNGYHIFTADKNHIHHRLMDLGFSNKGILLLLYTITIVYGSFAIIILYLQPIHALITIVLIYILSMLFFYMISVTEKKVENLENEIEKLKKK